MKVDQIRQSFLEFFEKKGHTVVASDSLVPQNDPTLLFTGAGMNQFKENFLGLKKDLKRAASSQKCLRTGDLDEVGRTAFHHSFFEMLGNFSFGDYFKKEAIEWAWEFLTRSLKIPKERLRVSVHRDDREAFDIWSKIVRSDWIYKLGDKDNFWPSNAPKNGPNGPCGPCSEIYFDMDPSKGAGGSVEDSSRFTEIWNLVFTQFDRQDGGKLVPLAQKNIDTGMGLERLACVLQGKKSNFEIDIFEPINREIKKLLDIERIDIESKNGFSGFLYNFHFYSISDHIRAVNFCMADGVIPSNEERGYVVRKLIRRSIWHAYSITLGKLKEPFLFKLVPIVSSVMGKFYPELIEAEKSISSTLKGEEERFLDKLETGLSILRTHLTSLSSTGKRIMSGEAVFILYDTHGFPDELTKKIANAHGFQIDQKGFDKLMTEQRKRAKDASQISGSIFVATDLDRKVSGLPPTKFLGYETLTASGKVLVAEFEGKKGFVVLDQTPCYAESGGQVGDQGVMENSGFKAWITDTQKKDVYVIHYVETEKGALKTGDQVKVTVDQERRERAMRNHTATHLLHAALRKVLGNQVRQLGSLVAPEKLRFDYSYSQPLTLAQRREIEDLVNQEILKDTEVSKEEKPIEEAKKDGAIAFFGEKYGNRVRVVSVPGFSKEFCGGTHCNRTGQIGLFLITSDSSIASGTRRIEAVTGEGALELARVMFLQREELMRYVRSNDPNDLQNKLLKLQEENKTLKKQLESGQILKIDADQLLKNAQPVTAGVKLIPPVMVSDLEINQLRALSDAIRSKSSHTVYMVGTSSEGNMYYALGMSPDLKNSGLDMKELSGSINPVLNANSGGRVDLVQGGAPDTGQFEKNKNDVNKKIVEYVKLKFINIG